MRARCLTIAALVLALPAPAANAHPRGLQPFASCSSLLGYVRTHAAKAVRTGWVPAPMMAAGPQSTSVPLSGSGPAVPTAAPAQGADSAAGSASPSFSTTNDQEQGVDEPDIVKTDGKTVYAIANGWLHAVNVSGDAPKLLDAMKLDDGYGHQLLLDGDRLLVLQTAWLDTPAPARQAPSAGGTASSGIAYPGVYGRPVTRLTEIDVSDPAHLRVVARERDDGEYVTARLVGHVARVVLASRAPVMYAVAATRAPTAAGAVSKRVRAVRRAKLAAWRPHRFFRKGKRRQLRSLVGCRSVSRPRSFSGLDTATVLTVDMSRGLPSTDARAIMSDAQTIYASPDRLYVATQRWLAPAVTEQAQAPDVTTQIHAFDTSDPWRTTYLATGQVKGFLLDQFAMSENAGVLRVASTEQPDWWSGGAQDAGAGSAVDTLDADTMAPIGHVGGLGRGQRIYAVRFIGDAGYVVTFRQVDPLYTLDLSQPAHPRVAGRLELQGYSAYLHPLGGDLLLGVGRSVGAGNEPSGSQLSLFDVADPAHPTLLASHAVGDGSSSEAEYDHHAFLYWPAAKLAVLPVQIYGTDPPFVGAIGFHVTREGIAEAGRIVHPHDDSRLWDVQRVTVIGDRLFSLSDVGVLSSSLADLSAGPFVAFPDKPVYYECGGPPMDTRVVARPCPLASSAPASG